MCMGLYISEEYKKWTQKRNIHISKDAKWPTTSPPLKGNVHRSDTLSLSSVSSDILVVPVLRHETTGERHDGASLCVVLSVLLVARPEAGAMRC